MTAQPHRNAWSSLASESQKKANDALFKGLEQLRNLTADARQLERLQSAAQGATGQMQTVGDLGTLCNVVKNDGSSLRVAIFMK